MTEKYQAVASVVSRQIGDEKVLVPIHTDAATMNSIFLLNDVGQLLWNELSESPRALEELAATVSGNFDVNEEVARTDAREFLEQLIALRLAETP